MTEAAERLAQIDQRLTELAAEKDSLIAERMALSVPVAPVATYYPPPSTPVYGLSAPKRAEASPRSVQNTLLTLGALLLVGAVLVFAAVTYRQLGVAGRAVVLLMLTGATVPAAQVLSRRGLGASAEAVTSIGLALGVVDAYALRRAGWGDGVDGSTYAAVSGAVLAGLSGTWLWIDPRKATHKLQADQIERLCEAIHFTLAEAIKFGSSLKLTFDNPDSKDALFYYGLSDETNAVVHEKFAVYDRAGEPCRACGTPIKRIVQAARSTFLCPACQRKT